MLLLLPAGPDAIFMDEQWQASGGMWGSGYINMFNTGVGDG